MSIDWTTRDRALDLAYIVEASYHDENGMERMVHWCGPKARVGSGLSVPVPEYPGNSSPTTTVWEARLTRGSMDLSLGNIDQSFSVISDLTFQVDIAGGSQASVPVAGDLRRDIVFGRWRNKGCRVWVLDLETGDTQIMGRGHFDKNPSSIGAGSFQVVINIDPLLAVESWPQGKIPLETSSFNSPVASYYWPTQFALNPNHAGRFLGLNFGDGVKAEAYSTPTNKDYVWKEIVPYGRRTAPVASSHYVYAWVSPQFNCYVDDIWFENGVSGSSDAAPGLLHDSNPLTFENTDPGLGPIGTCVRFLAAADPSGITPRSFRWWDEGEGYPRVSARVSGPVTGQRSSQGYDFSGGNPVWIYAKTGAPRSAVWDVVEDVVTSPQLLNRSDVLGAGSIAAFQASAPVTQHPVSWANLACAVPLEITDTPIPVREGLGGLGRFFPFDYAQRIEPSTGSWKLYPVWRSSFLSDPRYVFTVEDMSRTDPPAVAQYDNSDGKYANSVSVDTPIFSGEPTWPQSQDTAPELLPPRSDHFVHTDTFEQMPEREDAEIAVSLKMKHWLHMGRDGNASASWALGEERSQPQRSIQATHGIRSYRVSMGDPIKYDMVGINSDVGMVRKMRYDFDLQQVQITSLHIDHSTSRTSQRGSDPKENTGGSHSDPEG